MKQLRSQCLETSIHGTYGLVFWWSKDSLVRGMQGKTRSETRLPVSTGVNKLGTGSQFPTWAKSTWDTTCRVARLVTEQTKVYSSLCILDHTRSAIDDHYRPNKSVQYIHFFLEIWIFHQKAKEQENLLFVLYPVTPFTQHGSQGIWPKSHDISCCDHTAVHSI